MSDGESKQSETNGISQQRHDETNTNDVERAHELSQTDHLNKRLLDSFLQKLNETQPDASVSSASDNAVFEDDKPQIN